ncbi:hypothetical protein TCAL_14732 [Tigriopus californicus]|uniref:G-protein coupled receptors family 1 profile domain-containing protein n=1 Tax=Tigriopus californicus TaxID=6832 RepID=A0A553PEW6_TIGCA|nr:uncharacterized protein LOC131880114 [Tigriopus californicus]TRY76222.1 hypothetical protein TCAL_14732 [Tigriopus californicus]
MESSTLGEFNLSSFIEYDCPVYGNNSDHIIDQVIFWVEGVGLSAVATFGIIGNLLASVILSRHELRNSFNLLLIGLAFFDTCYIVGSLLETVRKSFRVATQTHLLLFPYLLYPGQMIAMTGSVFMIVAIAFERYVSVHHPLDYNQAMNDGSEIRKRLLKYFVPVVLLAVIINVPKFFETEAVFVPIDWTANRTNTDDTSQLLSSSMVNEDHHESSPLYEVRLNVTSMRIDPIYSSFVNWSQLIILGILPVCLLVYFNTKIYIDVKEREKRRRPQNQRDVAAMVRSEANTVLIDEHVDVGSNPKRKPSDPRSIPGRFNLVIQDTSRANRPQGQAGPRVGLLAMTVTRIQRKCCCRAFEAKTYVIPPASMNVAAGDNGSPGKSQPSSNLAPSHEEGFEGTAASSDPSRMSNARRRRVEDRMAILFMGIVTFFLLCHFPRILLNFYEMLVIEQAMACSKMGQRAFAVWAQIMTSISHFLLVTNSSINILIYSLFNTQFRAAAKNLFRQVQTSLACQARVDKMASCVPSWLSPAGLRRRNQNSDTSVVRVTSRPNELETRRRPSRGLLAIPSPNFEASPKLLTANRLAGDGSILTVNNKTDQGTNTTSKAAKSQQEN